jgi:YggT family protein
MTSEGDNRQDGACGSILLVNATPLQTLLNVYSLIVLVRVITSWIQLPPDNPVVYYTRMLTEPLLEPIRKILPPTAGLDFSPLILLLLLRFIAGMV